MDSDEATALNKRYCDRKQELKEDFKPDDYNGMGIKRRMRRRHETRRPNGFVKMLSFQICT
jgi:hypothetical protein